MKKLKIHCPSSLKVSILFVWLISHNYASFSQSKVNVNTDSLDQVFRQMKDDTAKINLMHRVSVEYYRQITEDALRYNQTADSLSAQLTYNKGLAKSQLIYSHIYRVQSKRDDAMTAAQRSLELYSDLSDGTGQAKAWKEIGLINMSLRKMQAAKDALDQALVLFKDTKRYEDEADIYNIMTSYYSREAKYDSAQLSIKKAYKLASTTSNTKLKTSIYTNWGNIYIYQSINDSAIYYYKKGVEVQLDQAEIIGRSALASLYGNIGLAEQRLGNYLSAIDYMLKTVEIRQEMGLEEKIAGTYVNIGNTYDLIKSYSLAIEYFEKSLAIYNKYDNQYGEGVSLINMGAAYFELKNMEEAQLRIMKGYNLLKELPGCTYTSAVVMLGDLYLELENLDSAQYYYDYAYRDSEKCGIQAYMALAAYGQGAVAIKRSQYNMAENYLLRADNLAIGQQLTEERKSITLKLYELYKKLEKNDKALHYYEQSIVLRDTIYNQEKAREFAQIEYQHELDREKRLMEAETERNNLVYEQELQKEKTIQYFAFSGIAAFLVISIILFRFYQTKKKDNSKIIQQSDELQKKHREMTELASYKQGLTHMIAHDMKNPLNVIIAMTQRKMDEESWQEVGQSGQLMLQMVNNMLDIQRFEETQMNLNIQNHHLSNIANQAKYQIELLMMAKSIRFENRMDQTILVEVDADILTRIFVNLYTNAIKYMPVGGRISLESIIEGDRIVISVADTGQGIEEDLQQHIFDKFWQSDPKKIGMSTSNGLGLTFCKLAVLAHGGSIKVKSKVGEGATFSFDLKLAAGDADSVQQHQVAFADESNLTTEEISLIQAMSNKLREIPIYKSSKIEEVLKDHEGDDTTGIKHWKKKIREASFSFDNEAFEQLINY